jgi:hypothetical protein
MLAWGKPTMSAFAGATARDGLSPLCFFSFLSVKSIEKIVPWRQSTIETTVGDLFACDCLKIRKNG